MRYNEEYNKRFGTVLDTPKSSKPVVRIEEATIGPHGFNPNVMVLGGLPVDHPKKSLNGALFFTSSSIVEVIDDEVETLNTVYKVLNWA